MVLVIRLEWEWEDSGRDGREERNEPSLWGVMVVTLIITHHVDFFLYIVIFWAEENQKYVHKIKEQYRQKSKNREKNGQSKRQQQPRRKSTQREGTGDEKVSYSTTTCAANFFLAACFFNVSTTVWKFLWRPKSPSTMVCEKSHNRVKCQSMHMLCCGVRFTSFFSAEETVVGTEEARVEVGAGEWW